MQQAKTVRYRATRVGSAFAVVVATALLLHASPASAQTTAGRGWIRFAHFSPANGPVRVAIDGKSLARSVTFETVTPYRSEGVGVHRVTLTDIGAPHHVLTDRVTLRPGGAVTVGAIQLQGGTVLESFADNRSDGPPGDARVRVIDTAPSVPSLRVVLAPDPSVTTSLSGQGARPTAHRIVTPPVAFARSSPYEDVAAGSYDVEVTGSDRQRILTGKGWPVTAGTVASVVVISQHGQPTLEVLRDAAGSSNPPIGAMQTGFGGAAGLLAGGHHRSAALEVVEWIALLGTAAALGTLVVRVGRDRADRHLPLRALALVVIVTATGCAAPHGAEPAATPKAPTPIGVAPDPVVGHGATVNLAGATSAPVVPTSLSIPSIGVKASIIRLGREANGSAQVPATTTVAGWYVDGPAPGQPGPAVILGHVDSYRGPGVFFKLHELAPGALIDVREGAATLRFRTEAVDSYAKATFPTSAVFGPTPDRALRLVTCGGAFDRSTGHYVDNLVVFATEVGNSPAGG